MTTASSGCPYDAALKVRAVEEPTAETGWSSDRRPRQDSNLRTRLRRPVLYPLSYEGGKRPHVAGVRLQTTAGWAILTEQ